MKINTSISSRFNSENKNTKYQKNPLIRQNLLKDDITFGAKSFANRVEEKKPKSTGWWETAKNATKWALGGKQAAETAVIKEMENEIRIGKIKVSGLTETLNYKTKYLDELKVQNAASIKSKNATIEANEITIKQNEATILNQQNAITSNDLRIKKKQAASKELEKYLEKQKSTIETHKFEVKQPLFRKDQAKRQNDKKLQESLAQEMEKLEKEHKIELGKIEKNINKASMFIKVFENLENMSKIEGFGKIAGYNDQKKLLLDRFAAPIALEKANKPTKVPGGILFFGPQGSGKSTFAEAFAHHLNCKFAQINPTDDFKKLKKTAEDAQEKFKIDRTRTVILINEFDEFAPKDSPITPHLKDFMDDCSKKYHCTIFATTNYPERIDDILLRDGRFYKTALPPANKENATAILKHYAGTFTDKDVNYEELAEHITKVQPENAFSNGRIKALVTALPQKFKNAEKKLSHNTLLQSIKEATPDIDKKALEAFQKQIKYVKQL
jgi:SpoVK/Ycf46/Vps4 family AAA+-type ATPase